MRIKKSDAAGTIHELPVQLANLSELDKINPKTTKAKNEYLKVYEKFKLFTKEATLAEKKAIIAKLKVMNFDEGHIEDQKRVLQSTLKFNKLVDKKREEIENQIRSGKNVKHNVNILKGIEKYPLEIPNQIRRDLQLIYKETKLLKFNSEEPRNSLKFYSGQNYKFRIKDGFNKIYYVDYEQLQKIRREGNVVEFILKKFKEGIDEAYNKDKLKYEKSEPKKWLAKKKVYEKKIYKVIEHNINVATNKKYNKKLVQKDKKGKIIKDEGNYPVNINLFHEFLHIYIP